MVFLSTGTGENGNYYYFVHPEWHRIGAEITTQVIAFLENSALPKNGKSSLVHALNRTLNVLGGAMYHLRNYSSLEQSRTESLKSTAPPSKNPGDERLVLMPDLQCEMQAFLMQVQRSFETLPDMMKPMLSVPKDISFGSIGERIIDVLQAVLISDIADLRKHPVEKLIRLMEREHDFNVLDRGKRRSWLRFFADFKGKAMREREPAVALFRIRNNPEGTVDVTLPMYGEDLPLSRVLQNTWERAVDFHRDFYSLMVFWTLRPQYSFTMLPESEQERGRKWAVVGAR